MYPARWGQKSVRGRMCAKKDVCKDSVCKYVWKVGGSQNRTYTTSSLLNLQPQRRSARPQIVQSCFRNANRQLWPYPKCIPGYQVCTALNNHKKGSCVVVEGSWSWGKPKSSDRYQSALLRALGPCQQQQQSSIGQQPRTLSECRRRFLLDHGQRVVNTAAGRLILHYGRLTTQGNVSENKGITLLAFTSFMWDLCLILVVSFRCFCFSCFHVPQLCMRRGCIGEGINVLRIREGWILKHYAKSWGVERIYKPSKSTSLGICSFSQAESLQHREFWSALYADLPWSYLHENTMITMKISYKDHGGSKGFFYISIFAIYYHVCTSVCSY